MLIKWGFGLEKETSFIGYNKGFKNFSHDIEGNRGVSGYTHNESEMVNLGEYAKETYDGTVYSKVEFISSKKKIKNHPKEIILGFIKDTEERAKKLLNEPREFKRTIPFGSVPGLTSRDMGDNVAGSYHFNITFPYDADSNDFKDYEKKLKKGLLNMRVIQPLILALIGGIDSDSIGNPSVLEGSLRQSYSSSCSSIAYAKLKEGSDSIFKAITHKIDNPEYGSPNNGGEEGYGRGPSNNIQEWRNIIGDKPNFVNGRNFYTDIRIKAFKKEKVPTIEFRFLDTFDTRGTLGVLGAVSMAMANGERTTKFEDPNSNLAWSKAMAEIIKEGWNSYVDKEYVEYINTNMKLNINITTTKIRADILLSKVLESLWKKNKSDEWVKNWYDTKPEIHNFNKDAWEFYLTMKLKNDSDKNKFVDFLNIIKNIDASKSNGWIKVNYKNNKYAVRDIILDESVLGNDYGFEDTEDILHFLHRYEVIKIREDKSGRIVDIKKDFNTDDELNTKLKNILNESDMLNGNEGLIKSEEVANFTPITAPEPRVRQPSTTPEVAYSISGDITVYIHTPIEEEVASNYAEDFEDIVSGVNLRFNGRRLRINIKYAKLETANGLDFNRPFWKKVGGTIILYVPPEFETIEIPSAWINRIKNLKMWTYDRTIDKTISKVPYDGYPDDFYSLLENEALNEYSKNSLQDSIQTIKTDRAGIKRLNDNGIMIVSFKRGKSYKLITTKIYNELYNSNPDVRQIQYIPYQKGYIIKIKGNKFALYKNNIKVSLIGGENGKK